jgi:hypothetical protein
VPIVHEYRVPAAQRAEALAAGAGAMAGEDQRRYQDQLAHRDRLFEYQLDQSAIDNQLRADSLGQQRYMFNAGQAQQAAEFGARNQLAWAGMDLDAGRLGLAQQQLDQNAWQIEQDAIANNVRANAAIEQQRMKLAAAQQQKLEEQKMSMAIRSQDAIEKAVSDGRINTQAQYDAAIQQWEQQTGLDYNFPKRAIAEQQMREGETRRSKFVNSHAQAFGLDPSVVDGLTFEGEGGVPMLTIPPETLASMGKARMDDKRLRDDKAATLKASADEFDKKLKIDAANSETEYRNKVKEAEGKAIARFNDLLLETIERMEKANPEKQFGVDDIDDERKKSLWKTAQAENPKPIPPPGVTP